MKKTETESRQALLQRELDYFVKRILKNYGPEKILLFGSFAKGDAGPVSDLDVVILKETDRNFWDRLKDVSKFCSRKVGMDVLVYTPAEFDKLLKERRFFREEIKKKGKVLYEKAA